MSTINFTTARSSETRNGIVQDLPRTAVQPARSASQSFVLPQPLTETLNALSRREGVTLFMTLLAAFQTLLHRYSGQEDILVSSPTTGRTQVGTEGLIGRCANTLVLRTDFSGNPTFRELLAQVRTVVLSAQAQRDLPDEKLLEALQLRQDVRPHPLFQLWFDLRHAPTAMAALPGSTLSLLETDGEVAAFDLALLMREEAHELTGILQYNADLFDSATISRLLGHFQILLHGMVDNPAQRLSVLPLLTAAERHQLLVEWNNTTTDDPHNECIHWLFEAQVEHSPNAIAVEFAGQQLTYRELNLRANQTAHHLRALGVGPEVLVGIYAGRSLEMIVGLLGVLKAGGAYVALEPTDPKESLSFMLEDAQVLVLLTQQRLVAELPEHRAMVICLDADWETIAREPEQTPARMVTADNLACVLYTSGSTGKPKGVMLQHRSVVNYIKMTGVAWALGPGDRILQFMSISFDASLEEIFSCLSHGATLVLRTDAMLGSVPTFLHNCHDLALTVLDLPTGYWHELAAHFDVAETSVLIPSLRLVIIGGEKALRERLTAWQKQVGQRVRLVNAYGPTETTIAATLCELSGAAADTPRHEVPIGRPIGNVQLYVLDRHLQPVPVGVPGELHIGGVGLARGYLNRPELTAEKFIPHPYSDEPGARLYKTGDLVRYGSDGNLEFIGRIDHQVKIRGYRIEPGQIETVLSQHPAIREMAVLAREDTSGDKRLVAYVVPKHEPPPPLHELRRFLKERLPAYMIPSTFVLLPALPFTSHGKVDRRALPAPDYTRPELAVPFVAPQGTVEHKLTQIWEELLGIQPIGIKDNFFELGGHSLLAVRMMDRIERIYGQSLSLTTLFTEATIEYLASALCQAGELVDRSLLLPFQARGSKPIFFCIFGSLSLASCMGTNQPVYGLLPHGLAGRRVPSTVEAMAADYIKEIQALQSAGPYFLGGFSFGGTVVFEIAQQLQKQGQEVAFLALLDPDSPSNVPDVPHSRSAVPALPPSITLFRTMVSRHWCNLAALSPQEQLSYMLARVQGRIQGIIKWIEGQGKKIACWFYLSLGRRLPPSLRGFYFHATADQAAQRYVPRKYTGGVILFRTKDRSPHRWLTWEKLTAGGLEVFEVSGDHATMMEEPHVRGLAEQLQSCLHKAQANTRQDALHRH